MHLLATTVIWALFATIVLSEMEELPFNNNDDPNGLSLSISPEILSKPLLGLSKRQASDAENRQVKTRLKRNKQDKFDALFDHPREPLFISSDTNLPPEALAEKYKVVLQKLYPNAGTQGYPLDKMRKRYMDGGRPFIVGPEKLVKY